MAASVATSANLSVTLSHAISFLTKPLGASHSPETVLKLQLQLEASLTNHYAPTWNINDPLRGSAHRCLTLSPGAIPPRAIYAACLATGVQWFEWIASLGGQEFDFLVDPGHVSLRLRDQLVTVWADEGSPAHTGKSFAQLIMEQDGEDDEQLFNLIADETKSPAWIVTPSTRSTSPLSAISAHSRCSSRSSNASSSKTFSSVETSPSRTSPDSHQSRRERARQARVFVDTSKTEVTPYDGGNTTVLTGGVMLGGSLGKPKKPSKSSSA
ncbi:hypothetical protein AX16_005553 [Volvariella volvacea WC 439]|nr:hypothetical protein AX16_005553 [Volvariella volvacea WC 439]